MKTMKNRINLIGNVGVKPRLFKFESGAKIAKFSFATNERMKNKAGEWVTETTWHQVSAWGRNADRLMMYVDKGMSLSLEGRISYKSYDDKNGVKRYATEIILNDFIHWSN